MSQRWIKKIFYTLSALMITGCFLPYTPITQDTAPAHKKLTTPPRPKPQKSPKVPTQENKLPPPPFRESMQQDKYIEQLQPEIYFQQITSNKTLMDGSEEIRIESSKKDSFQIINIYDKQGNLRATLSFKNKMLEGISRVYKNGKVIREVPYKSGQINGIMKTYKNNIRIEESYQNGKKHGQTRIYTADKLSALKNYHNGILEGESLEYNKRGDITLIASYQNGKKHGTFKGFANNRLVYVQEYRNNFLQGESRTYGENEVLKIQRFYKNGLLDGKENIYDYPSKKLIATASYQNGVLVTPYQNYIYDKNDLRIQAVDTEKFSTQAHDYMIFYTLKPIDDVRNSLIRNNDSLYTYQANSLKAFTKSQDSTKITIKTYFPQTTQDTLESSIIITPESSSGTFYNKKGSILSRFQYTKDSHIVWTYNNDGSLHTKSEERPGKNIIQTYKNNKLESEIIWIEAQNITIQRGFYPNRTLHFEHHYKDNVIIEGKLYDVSQKKVYSFTYSNEDEIFDMVFPQTAALKRKKVTPH